MRHILALTFFALLVPGVVLAAPLVNINTADAALLDTLPGIGGVKAQAIIDFRTASGSFPTIDAIQNVPGIGPVTYAKIKSLITIVGGISTAPPPEPVQPKPVSTGSTKVSKVVPVTSTKTISQSHEQDLVAPTAAANTAAVGASLSAHAPSSWLTSPWFAGFLGLLVFSGATLIVL